MAVKACSDGNPNALDAALDALVAFLGRADEEFASRCVRRAFETRRLPETLPSCAGALANALVSKALSGRPKTVTRASEALLLLVELDAAEAVTARAARSASCARARAA